MGVHGLLAAGSFPDARSARGRARVVVAAAALCAVTLLAGCTASTGPAAEPTAGATVQPPTATPTTVPTAPDPSLPSPTSAGTGGSPTAPGTSPPAGPARTPGTASPSAPASPPAPVPPGVPGAWRGLDVTRVATQRPVVALTFDAGSSDAAVPSILATLSRYGVRGTFFVTGQFARRYPAAVRAMSAAGHPVGNHSDTHPNFTQTSTAEIQRQLVAAEAAIRAATGSPARPLFRFPYGARTALDIRVVNDAGYVPFRWTVDTLGWKGTGGGQSAASVRARVLDAAQPGEIVLMHVGANPDDGSTLDADALPGVIEGLQARGYSFITLRSLLP